MNPLTHRPSRLGRTSGALLTGLGLWLSLGVGSAAAQGARPRVSPGDTVKPAVERLAGTPQSAGLYAEREKFTRNFRTPPHWHDRELHVTVLRGALYVGRGDHFDLTGVRPLGPESFLIIPAGVHHFEWVPRGTVLQLEGVGPVTTTYVE